MVWFAISALIWLAAAVGQVFLPGHTFRPEWFAIDVAACALSILMAVREARRQ